MPSGARCSKAERMNWTKDKTLEMLKEIRDELNSHAENGDWEHHANAIQLLHEIIGDLEMEIAQSN